MIIDDQAVREEDEILQMEVLLDFSGDAFGCACVALELLRDSVRAAIAACEQCFWFGSDSSTAIVNQGVHVLYKPWLGMSMGITILLDVCP